MDSLSPQRFNPTYTLRNLVDTYVELTDSRDRSVHPDFLNFYSAKFKALETALGIEFETKRPWERDGEQITIYQAFDLLFDSTVRYLNKLELGPFGVYLEGRPEGIEKAARAHFEKPVAVAQEELKNQLRQMLYYLAESHFPEAAKRVLSAAEVKASGFDPETSRAPDPIDYW